MKGKVLKVIKDGIEMQPDSPVAEVGECVVDKGVLRPLHEQSHKDSSTPFARGCSSPESQGADSN
jgi:hypothetical protein